MCFIVLPRTAVRKLIAAAQNVQSLLDDGTLGAAFQKPEGYDLTLAVTGFDVLAQTAAALASEQKEVSPYLRFRREILAEGDHGEGLRALVLALWIGKDAGLDLGALFRDADDHHARIALELIAAYANNGADAQFRSLALLLGMGAAA